MTKGYFKSPYGIIEIGASSDFLESVLFVEDGNIDTTNDDPDLIKQTKEQLQEFFNGTRTSFDLPIKLSGTEFQQSVLKTVLDIPFGETRSYGDIALNLGDKNLVRAIGAANGSNQLLIVVPCHRVIGATGSLVGYAGGIDKKRALLNFERYLISRQKSLF